MSGQDFVNHMLSLSDEERADFEERTVAMQALLDQLETSRPELNHLLYTWRWILPWNTFWRTRKLINQNARLLKQAQELCPEMNLLDA